MGPYNLLFCIDGVKILVKVEISSSRSAFSLHLLDSKAVFLEKTHGKLMWSYPAASILD